MHSNLTKNNNKHVSNQWGFVPTALIGFSGVAIGLAIGNLIGWI